MIKKKNDNEYANEWLTIVAAVSDRTNPRYWTPMRATFLGRRWVFGQVPKEVSACLSRLARLGPLSVSGGPLLFFAVLGAVVGRSCPPVGDKEHLGVPPEDKIATERPNLSRSVGRRTLDSPAPFVVGPEAA